jgi:hypothetical protein
MPLTFPAIQAPNPVSTNAYSAGTAGFTSVGNPGGVLLANVHPLPQAAVPNGSVTGWIWLLVVLALVVAGGVVLTSRR